MGSQQLINSNSYFSTNNLDIRSPRSRFNRSCSNKTSFNVGDLVPIFCDEVLPGDTFDMSMSSVTRLQTLITPPFDDLYLDTFFFFVPARLCFDDWKLFMGESDKAWLPSRTVQVPKLQVPVAKGNEYEGTLLDYFGLPVHSNAPYWVNRMPFNAYALIWNNFFRDENLQDPLLIYTKTSTQDWNEGYSSLGGKVQKANKMHDYFTSCLPSPQKGMPVTINALFGDIPVTTRKDKYIAPSDTALKLRKTGGAYSASRGNLISGAFGEVMSSPDSAVSSNEYTYPANLFGDMSRANPVTINDLRLSFATQQLLELDARGGSRYAEILLNHFGVTCPDASLQVPELLGGERIRMDIRQIVQNSETSNTPLGTTAGMSVTGDSHHGFTKSFTEHGFVIGLATARYSHTYGQGIEAMWQREDRLDYYFPVLANIGEQPVYKSEIWAGEGTVGPDQKKSVFGYEEAWAEYRYKPSYLTSEMRVDSSKSLSSWHFADYYKTAPFLSDKWIEEDPSNVDRTLAVTSSLAKQIFGDFYFDLKCTRRMPVHSIPGLTRM